MPKSANIQQNWRRHEEFLKSTSVAFLSYQILNFQHNSIEIQICMILHFAHLRKKQTQVTIQLRSSGLLGQNSGPQRTSTEKKKLFLFFVLLALNSLISNAPSFLNTSVPKFKVFGIEIKLGKFYFIGASILILYYFRFCSTGL